MMTLGPPPITQSSGHICPICSYDLTGLVEPQCPECGYRFSWEEFDSEGDAPAPRWLYEHGGRYLAMQLKLLAPWRMWRAVRPGHRVRPRRLARFGILSLVFAIGLPLVATALTFYSRVNENRVKSFADAESYAYAKRYDNGVIRPATPAEIQASRSFALTLLDLHGPNHQKFWRSLLPEFHTVRRNSQSLPIVVSAVAAMPLTVLIVLLSSRQTLRQTKMPWVHHARVLAYTVDPAFLGVALTVAIVFAAADLQAGTGLILLELVELIRRAALIACGVAAGVTLLRLHFGLRTYLRVQQAWAMTLVVGVGAVGMFIALLRVSGQDFSW